MAYRNGGAFGQGGNSPNSAGPGYSPAMAHAQVPHVQQPAMNAYGAQYAPQQSHAGYGGGSGAGGGAGGGAQPYGMGGGSGVPHYGFNAAQGGFASNQGE